MLFEKDYSFKGTHAEKVKQLVENKFDKDHKLFERNMDVYLMAPIVGFLQGRRAPLDKSSQTTTNILAAIMIQYKADLLFNYRLIMMLDKDYEPDQKARIDKAFRHYGDDEKNKQDFERFEEYVRGGVDYLYEKLCQNSTQVEDYTNNLYDLVTDFNEKYGDLSKEIFELCEFARG